MPEDKDLLTAKEFASLAGVKPGTITNWIRSGKLKGTKKGRRWMIPRSQIETLGKKEATAQTAPDAGSKQAGADVESKLYTIAEFAAMTYLTELGVERWLKAGRLKGRIDSSGTLKIEASSLKSPYLKHLLRS